MNSSAKFAGRSPSAPRRSYGQVAARGLAWTTAVVMAGRVTGFVSNLILGWLLAPHDFGIYAMAIGVSVIAITFRSAGIQKLLIRHGDQYDQLAQPFARLSLIINLSAMMLLGLIGPLAAKHLRSPTIVPLIWIIGLSMPLAVPAEILRCRLAIDLRFRLLAGNNAAMMFLTQLLTVGFALAGYGPYSFALPMAIVAAIESLTLVRLVGLWPAGRHLDWALARELSSSAMWIVLCGFAAALIVHGGNLVVGARTDAITTGLFFFGFQLSVSVAMFFSANMHRVLMPVMSHLTGEPRRQGNAYVRSVRMLATVAAPVCGLGVAVAAPVIHLCWRGKWDASIPVFQPLTTVLPVYIMTAIGSALLEARGLWRTNTLLHAISALGTMAAAWIGTAVGGLGAVAILLALYRCGYAIAHGCFMMKLLERRPSEYLRAVVPPCAICAAAAWFVIAVVPSSHAVPAVNGGPPDELAWDFRSPLIQLAFLMFGYGLIVTVAYRLFLPGRVTEMLRTTRALRRGGSAVTDEI